MGHIQPERLPKSKMASGDDRFTFEIERVLCFGNTDFKKRGRGGPEKCEDLGWTGQSTAFQAREICS